MRARVYLPTVKTNQEEQLNAEQSRYLCRVLRLQNGAAVEVFNGRGGVYEAQIISHNKDEVRLAITKKLPAKAEDNGVAVCIGQAICTAAKMDWAVEKMTELGATQIAPLFTDNTDKRGGNEKRWRRLAIAAATQCGRAAVPEILSAQPLSDWLNTACKAPQKILLSPRGEKPLAAVFRRNTDATLLVGPESGLSQKEETLAQEAGFVAVHLGSRTLRTETAALTALAIIGSLP
ncbi:MAG: 16S rRNA (uracil(1498)-N(3))-methyltransferase [Candidatus Zeuxoniibacter abyssi]|nr:MAG: 16S rRNA (uracil(1498)-N(3))-methyltransferase [Candidatus Persebacteraceae bacterium AB1(2)]